MKVGLKPVEIAAQCGVTSNSIRNWSKEFRSHLSEGANASERSYTDRDATVLRYISTLKQKGMKTHEIAERLAEMTFGETESAEIKPAPIVPSEVPHDSPDKQDLTPVFIRVPARFVRKCTLGFYALATREKIRIH